MHNTLMKLKKSCTERDRHEAIVFDTYGSHDKSSKQEFQQEMKIIHLYRIPGNCERLCEI